LTAPEAPAETIKAEARRLGFEAAGIADPDAVAEAGPALDRFLELGRHGEMDWMAATAERRRYPGALWAEARSAVVVGMNYGPDTDPLALLDQPDKATISVYARNKDYHTVLKKRLKALARFMTERFSGELKVFVDTAPIMEKPLAEAAGLGWQGKHTNLVSREHGSWLFLGVLLTDLDLTSDAPHGDACGSCRRCLEVCPTNAFPAPYQLDARRCISYLTIEHKGHIPAEFRAAIGNRIYGCDDCLAVCPWNKFAATAAESRFHARADLDAPQLGELVELDDASFRRLFAGSPIKRTGRDRFVRNVLIAIGNSADPGFLEQVERRLGDESALVRAMAVWALTRLAEPARLAARKAECLAWERDPQVRAEWAAAPLPAGAETGAAERA